MRTLGFGALGFCMSQFVRAVLGSDASPWVVLTLSVAITVPTAILVSLMIDRRAQ